MEHQFPEPIGGDEHMLAELMLPDQAHVRSQDWTIFFLHKDQNTEDADDGTKEGKSKKKRRRRKSQINGHDKRNTEDVNGDASQEDDEDEDVESASSQDSSDDEEDEDLHKVEGPPLVYVLNLVNTKQDTTAKR